MEPVYEIHGLIKRYTPDQPPANDGVDLTIQRGEIFGILGDNGAGKSTLLKQMGNLLRPTAGTIRLFGQLLDQDLSYASRLISYMPQSGLSLNTLSPAEALYFTAHLRGLSRRDARAERDQLIRQWDLGSLRNRIANRLSGGQRRLVLMALAAAALPPVLLLDEPTNDLDPQHRLMVWDNLRALNQQYGTTIVFITHNALEAEKIIQRVGIMQQGKLLAVGRPGVLKAELNRQLRLSIDFDPAEPPVFDHLPYTHLSATAGRQQLLINRDDAPAYLMALQTMPNIEDFRLSTATLEDLYFSLTTSFITGSTHDA